MIKLSNLTEKKIKDYLWTNSLQKLLLTYPRKGEKGKYQYKFTSEYAVFFATANIPCGCDDSNSVCDICEPFYTCDFYRNQHSQPKAIFSIKRNHFRTYLNEFCVEFLSLRKFIFNLKHGQITVCQITDDDSLQFLHSDKKTDQIITEVKIMNENSMLVHSVNLDFNDFTNPNNYNQPIQRLYNIKKFISRPNYQAPELIS